METKDLAVNSKEEKLVRLAFTDDLTGLYNRRYFYRSLPEEIKKAAVLEKEFSLLMIDIDEFKQFNDKYGHLTGDNVLSSVAEILKKSTREEDVVARYAGDEFVVILPEAPPKAAFAVACRIVEATASYPFKGQDEEVSLKVTLSIGLATYPGDGGETKELIGQADKALYSSKHAGRNRVSKTSDVLEEISDRSKILSVFPCPKLIDREEELLELQKRLKETEKGKPNLIFIQGSPGMGKTRLLTEFRAFAQSKGAIPLTITCYEEKSQIPYQSLILALGRYIEHIDSNLATSTLQSLPGSYLAVLEEVIPAVQELPLKIPEVRQLNEMEKRFELFKAFYQLLLNISKDNSLLLLTDDTHFVDKATLGLLKYIGRLKKANILICCAYRGENLIDQKGEKSPLSELIEELDTKKTFLKLELGPFSLKGTLSMIETIFPGLPSTDKLSQLIYKTTTGYPLFIEETLRSLAEDNLIYFQKGKWHLKEISLKDIPASLEEAVHKRFKRLDEETKEVLKKAAVAGEEFDLDLLSELDKKAPGQLLELIDRTTNSQLIQEKEALNADEFSFISDRVRELLYELISLEERQETHHEIGEFEEKRHPLDLDKVAAKIAYHFSHTEDLKKAADFALKAALKAKELFVYEESLDYSKKVRKPRPKALESEEPLSGESHKEVVESIKFLLAGISNIRMYPKGSAMVTDSIKNAYHRLVKVLDENEILTFSEVKRKLLVNGVEIEGAVRDTDAAKKFIAFLSEHSLKSFSLLAGLGMEELISFLEALGMKKEELKEKGGFEKFLEDEEVENVVANSIVYVVAGEKTESREEQPLEAQAAETKPLTKEEIRGSVRLREGTPHSEAVNILEQARGQMGNLMEALTKIRDITSSLPGEAERQEIERLVTRKISSLDTSSLSSFLTQRTTASEVEEELHLKDKVIKSLPLSKISSLIEKMSPEYNKLSGKEKEDMGHLLNRFLNQARGTKHLPLIYQKLFQGKTLRTLLENISDKWEDGGKHQTRKSFLLDRAGQLLKKSPIDLLKDELPSIIIELASLDEESLVKEILKELVENLDNDTPDIRCSTSLLIKQIDEGLREIEKEKILGSILDKL
ncbi:diguanylate cyclase, partial [bacterium]|nr:diguanylate cyclase [bacterium]